MKNYIITVERKLKEVKFKPDNLCCVGFLTEYILTCHGVKSTSVNNKINDG